MSRKDMPQNNIKHPKLEDFSRGSCKTFKLEDIGLNDAMPPPKRWSLQQLCLRLEWSLSYRGSYWWFSYREKLPFPTKSSYHLKIVDIFCWFLQFCRSEFRKPNKPEKTKRKQNSLLRFFFPGSQGFLKWLFSYYFSHGQNFQKSPEFPETLSRNWKCKKDGSRDNCSEF